jgi:cytochrome c553
LKVNQNAYLGLNFPFYCARKMSKTSSLLKTLLALAVSLATTVAFSQDVKGDAAAGEKKNAMCIGCHGIAGYQARFTACPKFRAKAKNSL